MNFGSWDSAVHEDGEQLKRIETAKKAATTPASVDKEKKTAEFKGSGKNPYIATLDSCSCGDFIRRKLPCKHIYRLALELEGADVKQGINKNEYELPCDIFSLPVESQKILYDMCLDGVYHQKNLFALERNKFSELLFYKGFCVQTPASLEFISSLSPAEIRNILFSSNINVDDMPKKTAQKETLVAWIEKHFDSVTTYIDKSYVFLEFCPYVENLQVTIHRRLANTFSYESCVDVDMNSYREYRNGIIANSDEEFMLLLKAKQRW